MKKIILSVVLATSQLVMFSQTVNIHFKNGQTVEYPSENVDYVDFSEKASDPTVTAGIAVDLGLSVYWASCNLGAERPEEYGDYYAWGETKTKQQYTSNNYAYYNSNTTLYTNIGSEISGTEYDAATVNLGSDWRMPTMSEMQELIDKCTWEWTQIKNVNGYKVIGKNGNSIFLPAAGLGFNHVGVLLYYSTGSLQNVGLCYCLSGSSNSISCFVVQSFHGIIIRPVTTNPNAGGNPIDHSNDYLVTDKISASFVGGAYSSINGTIQSGSQLTWRFINNSSESVTLIGIQLINDSTNSESSNYLTESVSVVPGETKGYTTTVGIMGIQKPKIRFTYQYNQKEYTVEAAMPETPINSVEPDQKNAMSTADQKEYIEKVALEFMDMMPASDFIEIADLGEYIGKTYIEGYKWDNVGKWAEDAFEASRVALGTKTNENYTDGYSYKYNLVCTDYTALLFASNFTGRFVAYNGRWMQESANDLEFVFTDKRGNQCVIKLETAGNVKKVHAHDFLNWKDSKYDYNSGTHTYYYDRTQCTIGIPEKIVLSLTQGGNQIMRVAVNIDLSNISNEELDISKVNVIASSVIELYNGYKIDISKVAYKGNTNASAAVTMTKNGATLIAIGVAADVFDIPSVNVNAFSSKTFNKEDYDMDNVNAKNAYIKIDLLGKVQMQGTVADIRKIMDCIKSAENNRKDESTFKSYISQANALADVNLFYDGKDMKQATIKLEPFAEETWNGQIIWKAEPIICFYDGSSYSTFTAFFNQDDFKQTIKTFKIVANNYASLVDKNIKW